MSPKSKKQFDEIRQKSRAKIMEVALELFAQNGYHQTSISQIAKSAAISKGLMYNYFASKEELLTEIVMEAVQEFEKMSDTILKMPNPPEEKLKWITESAIELVQKDVKHWRLLTSLGLQTDVLTKLRDILRIKSENGLELAELLFLKWALKTLAKKPTSMVHS